jgi:hypothetical protein
MDRCCYVLTWARRDANTRFFSLFEVWVSLMAVALASNSSSGAQDVSMETDKVFYCAESLEALTTCGHSTLTLCQSRCPSASNQGCHGTCYRYNANSG